MKSSVLRLLQRKSVAVVVIIVMIMRRSEVDGRRDRAVPAGVTWTGEAKKVISRSCPSVSSLSVKCQQVRKCIALNKRKSLSFPTSAFVRSSAKGQEKKEKNTECGR